MLEPSGKYVSVIALQNIKKVLLSIKERISFRRYLQEESGRWAVAFVREHIANEQFKGGRKPNTELSRRLKKDKEVKWRASHFGLRSNTALIESGDLWNSIRVLDNKKDIVVGSTNPKMLINIRRRKLKGSGGTIYDTYIDKSTGKERKKTKETSGVRIPLTKYKTRAPRRFGTVGEWARASGLWLAARLKAGGTIEGRNPLFLTKAEVSYITEKLYIPYLSDMENYKTKNIQELILKIRAKNRPKYMMLEAQYKRSKNIGGISRSKL